MSRPRKFSVSEDNKTTITVSRDILVLIKTYAVKHKTTVSDATYRLLKRAFELELKREQKQGE